MGSHIDPSCFHLEVIALCLKEQVHSLRVLLDYDLQLHAHFLSMAQESLRVKCAAEFQMAP